MAVDYNRDALREKDPERPKIDFWIMIVIDLLKPTL